MNAIYTLTTMQINELRIGSWVVVRPFTQIVKDIEMSQIHPQVCQVTGIIRMGDSAIVYVNDNNIAPVPIKHIMGVPLTESMLEKGGFHKSRNEHGNTFHIIEDDGFSVRFTIEHWTKTDSEKYKNRFHADKVGKVEFVHQVQDILHALFGTKLDFSFLHCSEVVAVYEESNPNEPVAITIKTD